jgi:hypothetical protein
VPLIELSEEELALLLDSLEEAAFFRDARSNVVRSAVRRKERRVGSMQAGAPQGEDHRRKAREYAALAVKLRAQERRS